MTKRDFTSETENRILDAAKQVAPSDSWPSQAADWVGDKVLGIEHYLGGFDMGSTLDQADAYYRNVADLNNASTAQIEQIWQAVNATNDQYATRLSALYADLQDLQKQLHEFAQTLDPSAGNFNTAYIDGTLKPHAQAWIAENSTLRKLANKGLSTDDIKGMNQSELARWFSALARAFTKVVPGVSVGKKAKIPLGPNLALSVTNSLKHNSKGPLNIDLTAALSGNSTELEHMCSLTAEEGGVAFDKNGNPINSSISGKWEENSGPGLEHSWSRTKGDKTETVGIGIPNFHKFASISYSTSTAVKGGNVTSEIELEAQRHNHWKPLNPHPVIPHTPPIALIRKTWKQLPKEKQHLILLTVGADAIITAITLGTGIAATAPATVIMVEFVLAA